MRLLRHFVCLATVVGLGVPCWAQPVIWVVDDAADPVPITGTLTLRQAITNANGLPGLQHNSVGTYSNTSEANSVIVVQDGPAAGEPEGSGRLDLAVSGASPFHGETAFAYALPAAGSARLSVYDCVGRRVRTLLDGQAEAGTRAIAWDGRDETGRSLPAGVYLARLAADAQQASCRVVKLKQRRHRRRAPGAAGAPGASHQEQIV